MLPQASQGERGELAQGLELLGLCSEGELNESFIFLTHSLCVCVCELLCWCHPSLLVLPPLGPCRKAEGRKGILQVTFPLPTGEQAASCGNPAFPRQVRALVAQQQGNSQVQAFHF